MRARRVSWMMLPVLMVAGACGTTEQDGSSAQAPDSAVATAVAGAPAADPPSGEVVVDL